jgi:hypothetical protein
VPAGQHIRVPDSKPGGERPLVSMEGWARFEQKARQRRIEKRLEAARTAIRTANFADARAALSELKELDPANPDARALASQLERAEKARRPRRAAGAFAAAAAAFVAVVLGASWIGTTGRLQLPPMVAATPPAPVAKALLTSRDLALDIPIATSGAHALPSDTALVSDDAVVPETAVEALDEAPLVEPQRAVTAAVLPPAFVQRELDLPPAAAVEAPALLPPPAPQRMPALPAPLAATATATSGALEAVPGVVDETSQVRAVLQKYQAAYERLDAEMVHAVWPGVNEVALARAFEGLESQALVFKACDVQLRGATASVVCTGSTRYVPKIGSREPRIESRAWNFTLRKRANDWEIETARAER